MTYSYPEIKAFQGLHLQSNSFDVPSGSLEDAKNVVMTKDKILSKRRGFYEYLDPGGDTLNRLATYEEKLIAIFNNGVSSIVDTGTNPNETGDRTDLTGEAVTIGSPRVSRFAQSNKNFYFTTDNGVYKLESATSTITKSGMPPALDIGGNFLAENGPINGGDSTSDGGQVAYRVLFGKRDSNDNLIVGSPSDILSLTNAKVVGVAWTRTSNVVTVSAGTGHNIAVGMSVSISASSGGTPEVGDGAFTVTAITSTTYDFAETAADSSGTLDYATTRKPRIEYSIPSEIDSVTPQPFVQIYRTSQTTDADATPTADFKLVTERSLTSTEIANGFGSFDDGIDDILLGSELYTNPNSREGELQANSRPPLCDDMALYKEHIFYAATTSRHLINLDVIDSTTMIDGDYIDVETVGTDFRRYVGRTGTGNQTAKSESVAGTTTIVVTYSGHGYAIGDTVFVSDITGTLTEGLYTLTAVTASTFTFVAATGETASELWFQGDTTSLSGTDYPMFTLDISSLSLAVRIRNTAQGIVKAINRDSLSTVYAQYTSGISGTPGTMRIFAKDFGGAIRIRAITTAAGSGFSPALGTAFANTVSTNDSQQNAVYIAKTSEPEAVPLVNFLLIGARNAPILRIATLRDSLIVVKTDGVFRLTGDSVGSFISTALDTTVICVAASSVATINNQVIMLSNQGFCLITESSVQIISRDIEDIIQPIVGLDDIETATSAVSFETERIYLVSTLQPSGSGSPTITYAYNILNSSWTSWDEVFAQGTISLGDKLHTITLGNVINRQRKEQTKLDFSGQNYDIQVTAVVSSTTLTITSSLIAPEVDWVIVNNNVINRITSVVDLGGNSYNVTFSNTTTLGVTDLGWGLDPWGEFAWGNEVPIMYAGFETRIKMVPFHGGLVGRFKQFSQMQLHQRGAALSGLSITFGGPQSATSAVVDWTSVENTSDSGWGLGFWGEFGWGNEEGIAILTGTQPGAIVRVYIPIRQQRSTFIQPILEHNRAAEEINLQAMSFAVRAFQERVTR